MRLESNPTVIEFDPFQTQQAGAVTGPVTGSQFQYGTAHNVGEAVRTADGRTFRYTLTNASTALVAGTLTAPPVEKLNHQELNPTAIVAIGQRQFTVTLGATLATANEYTHGFANFSLSTSANVGLAYEISYNPAANSAATLQLTLFDPLVNAVATTDTVDLTHSQWYNVLQSPGAAASATARSAGVSLTSTAANYSSWVVSHGLAACLASGTIALGTQVIASGSVAGAVD